MNKKTILPLLLGFLFLTSCEKNDPVEPLPNFDIVSSELFEVLETYDNGWIKEAVKYDLEKRPILEFSYHQNGYLKSCRLYKYIFSGPGIYFEHERNETDQPLRSRFYDLEGNLYADLFYDNGELSSKVVYYENTEITFSFENGSLSSVEETDAATGRKTLVTYDPANERRVLEVDIPGEPGYTIETSLGFNLGAGYNAINDLPLLNLIESDDYRVSPVNTSSGSSLMKKTSVDANELCPAPINYYDLDDNFIQKFGSRSDALKMKSLINSDFKRSILEQYPFTEETVFIAPSSTVYDQHALDMDLGDIIERTNELKAQYPEDFELLYGSGYFRGYQTGKNLLIIGAIRNLPSDLSLRSQIIDAAKRYADDLLTGENKLTAEERDLLSKVFFQLKAHSNIEEVDGRIIDSYEDYQEVVKTINEVDPAIINIMLSRHF